MAVNKKELTEHQATALRNFPNEGWHRVDRLGMGDEAIQDYYYHTRRAEFTAELLGQKGYLESRVKPDVWKYSFELYREYRKVK